MNLKEAYEKQNRLIESYSGKLIGYKVGFSSKSIQEKFNIHEPAFGKLYDFMILKNNDKIEISKFKKPVIELEIAFKLSSNITEKILSIDILKKYIDSYYVSVELPDLEIMCKKDFTVFDIIADNIAAKNFILGREFKYYGEELEKCKSSLYLNGIKITEGSSYNVLEGPLNSLLWIVNKLIEINISPKKDDIILSGSMTDIVPAEKGVYIAEFENPDDEIIFTFI